MARSFPLHLQNVSGGIFYLAGMEVKHNEVATISEARYKNNKEDIEQHIKYKTNDDKPLFKVLDNQEAEETKQEQEDEKEKHVSVVGQHITGALSWRKTVDAIKEIDDIAILDALYSEGQKGDLNKDGAVMKAIMSQISAVRNENIRKGK